MSSTGTNGAEKWSEQNTMSFTVFVSDLLFIFCKSTNELELSSDETVSH